MPRKTKMNSITSPALLRQVNPKNQQLLNEFVDYLKSVQRSETTINAYISDIQIAWVWALKFNDNKFFVDWTKRNIVAYQNWLLNTNENSPARIRRLKASLSSLSNYIESVCDEDYPDFRNIIHKVESPVNQPVREKTVLTDEDVENTLKMLVDKHKYEVACFFALAVYGGRRKAEICRFRVSDFTEDKLICGGSLYKSDPIKTKGRGKGKYLNCYTLAKKFQPYLDLWMEERKEKGIESDWLFPMKGDPGEHVLISTVNSWVSALCRMTGLQIYAHCLRHKFCSSLSDEGIPDNVIKEILGWSDISMVGVYVDRDTDDTLDMYFDADGIKQIEKKGLTDL